MKQTLTRISHALSHALTRERRCEACGNEFSCGASLRGCWCAEIELSDVARAELQDLYRNCLCRACLEMASGRQSPVGESKE
jgi:Cysteine-rich CWC